MMMDDELVKLVYICRLRGGNCFPEEDRDEEDASDVLVVDRLTISAIRYIYHLHK